MVRSLWRFISFGGNVLPSTECHAVKLSNMMRAIAKMQMRLGFLLSSNKEYKARTIRGPNCYRLKHFADNAAALHLVKLYLLLSNT
jgi:hypothetical protein